MLIIIIPLLIVIEQRYFSRATRELASKPNLIQSYRQYIVISWSTLWDDGLILPASVQILNLFETAYLTGLWLILPYQMQIQENNLIVWLWLSAAALLINVIGAIINTEYLNSEIALAGFFKNGLSQVSCFLPIILSVMIVVSFNHYENFTELSLQQSGLWLGFIPRWNIFRSPFLFLTATGYLANLIILMRINTGDFQPFEFQELSEIYSSQHKTFGNFMQFNRVWILFTLSALMVFLFLGGWQSPSGSEVHRLASFPDGIRFLGKSIIVFSIAMKIKHHLPLPSVRQIFNFNLKIQVPALLLIWLSSLIGRWV